MPCHLKAHCSVFLAKKKNNPGVSRNVHRGEVSVFQADGSAAPVLALGNINFSFDSGGVLILKDVIYAPAVKRNLISVSKVLIDGYDVIFSNNGYVISYNKHFVSAG
ncbi:hypothetical protein MTR67_050890, partial [Solanum verrucosum]